jgi:hypothetical protein
MTSQLTNLDARLTFLALQYHLARPGAELDPQTSAPATRGLAEVAAALEPQLDKAMATIDLDKRQQQRLLQAMAGAVNELKAYPLFDPLPGGGRRTASPAFDATLRRLFPEVTEEPDEASQLAGHMLQLKRRLERAAPATTPAAEALPRKARWRFWGRKAG